MKLKFLTIFILFVILSSNFLEAQWEKIGFENENINDICLIGDTIVIPHSIYPTTTLYGSTNYGESWDSLGFIPFPWIENIAYCQNYIFNSTYWACVDFCSPAPCIFRFNSNWENLDTLYKQTYGVSNLLVHNNNLFAYTGTNFIRSLDLGNSWDTIKTPQANISWIYSMDNFIYLVNSKKEIFSSEDNGVNWNFVSNNIPLSINCLIKNDNLLFAGGNNGIAISSNNGTNWQISNTGLPQDFIVEKLVGKTNILFVSGLNQDFTLQVFYSIDAGKTWRDITNGLLLDNLDYISSIKIIDNYLFASTENGMWRYNFDSLVGVNDKVNLPLTYYLSQNYPNPFNPITTIKYSVPSVETGHAPSLQLKIYDILGRDIATLVNEKKSPGEYEVQFDGSKLPSGVYLYRLQAGNFSKTKKLILLR